MTAPRLEGQRQFTPKQLRALMVGLVRDWKIDPHDAAVIIDESARRYPLGVDDLCELLEMRGYPDLAESLMAGELE